jgi:nitrite reductase (NADH) large subunit
LILTAGAHPFVPPVPGIQRHGVHPLRTLDEAERILALARPGMRCVVVGGGILGMEMAAALAGRGLAVSLLEGSAHLMPRQLDARAGTLLAARAAELGVAVVTTSRTETLLGDEQVAGVRLVDGRTLPADLVLIATGVRANSHLARRVGLEVGEGVVVDDRLHASAPDVWAAGDVCEHRGVMYGNWAAAQAQGTIAGINAGGGRAEFGGIPRSNTVKVLGVDLVSIGAVHAGDASWTELTVEADGTYRRYLLRDGRLVGALFFGNATLAPAATAAITAGADCSGLTTATALEDRLRG